MNPLNYSRMRDTAESTFFDTCRLGTVQSFEYGALDSVPGEPLYSDAQLCGFEPHSITETQDGAQAAVFDAKLRLPIGTYVGTVDRIELTARHGEAISPVQIYSVEGMPERGPSAIVLNLKFITGESIR